MDIALDRVGGLVDQLDSSWEFGSERLVGLTDAEYLWEPVAGMWSVRPRGAAATARAFGPGAWQRDLEVPEPDPPPVTTIAWRLGHVVSGLAGRWEYTFGDRAADLETLVDFSPHASVALAELADWVGRWRAGLLTLTDAQLDEPGYGQYPWGLNPELPFFGIIWWVNRELIHHLAEAALLRDLYRARL